MEVFEQGETIVCPCTCTISGVLTSPSTSMKITITEKKTGVVVVDSVTMTEDSTGTYHYDYFSSATATVGIYNVTYVAVHATKTSKAKDSFRIAEAT